MELLGADALADQPAPGQAIHHLVNGGRATRADWAREVLRVDRASTSPSRRCPAVHLAARLHAAAVGRPRADAAAVGRADAPLARGVRRRRPGAPPGLRQGLTAPAANVPVTARSTGPRHTRTARDRTPRHRTRSSAGPKGPARVLTIPRLARRARRPRLERHSSRPWRSCARASPPGAHLLANARPHARRRPARRRSGLVAPIAAPAPAQAATGPKVAIIVGATHGSTAKYRDYGNEIAATALKYTSNVVKVFSPNATWSKVKAAVNGASIVVYLGHGNGWPSPYTYDPNYTTKDGFGLNYDVNGDGKLSDYENKYYGEPSIRTLTPAKNAVVLLFHLCYASGNSEPGDADAIADDREEARRQLRRRVHPGGRPRRGRERPQPQPVLHRCAVHDQQTIDQYWRNAPDFHDDGDDLRVHPQPGLHVPARSRGLGAATTARSWAR